MTQHDHTSDDPEVTELWRQVLTEGHIDRPYSYLPGANRCGMCLILLTGFGGAISSVLVGLTYEFWVC